MTRVKRGTTSLKRRRKMLSLTKGYRNARSTKEKQAHEAILHAGVHAFAHRRKKKGDFRRLWQMKMNAGLRALGLTYSKFIGSLKENKIELNRKMLADMAENNPDTFKRVTETLK
ncbi:50S ribosomal protein L20 [Patescibacteria group bacterium]|nr:50S ribosomal protein L20 [Patescibacteria group bacterium]